MDSLLSNINSTKQSENKLYDLSTIVFNRSYINVWDANKLLCDVILDTYGEVYYPKEVEVGNDTVNLLIENGSTVPDVISKSELEERKQKDVIEIFTSPDGIHANLYSLKKADVLARCPIEDSIVNPCAQALMDFVNFGINIKYNHPFCSWKTIKGIYYKYNNLPRGYDEELLDDVNLDYYDSIDEKERQRNAKKIKVDYYHKCKRESINKIQAAKKLEKIPKKYYY